MNRLGFTLIEVLASILLIGTALIPVMIIVPQIIENSLKTEKLTRVIFYGEEKMEETTGLIRDDFSASITSSGTFSGNYKYTVALTQDGSIPLTDVKIITVISWYDENGNGTVDNGEESITIDAKVANRG